MTKLTELSLCDLTAQLESKAVSSLEVTEAYLDAIRRNDSQIHAYLTVEEEGARAAASAIDAARAKGEALPRLAGVPVGIKDNICTRGVRTTCASKMLEHFIPPYDATVMQRLQGTVLLGKTNMDEFAMGSSTENSAFCVTHNPRNNDCVPGGSSGGSAAAVAANEAVFTLGSDTGGSIRQPASFCGVVGMKPTYGSVSRYGLVAFASSLDQIGPLTKTVADNALVLNALRGHDKADATSVARTYEDCTAQLEQGVRGMRIAILSEFVGDGIDAEVKAAIFAAAKQFEALGATVEEVSMPTISHALPSYYVISSAEASSNLARFDGVRYGFRSEQYTTVQELYENSRSEGFGQEVKRRIMLGTFALSSGYYDAYYKKALQVRTLIVNDYNKIFNQYDLILSPVAPSAAYRIGEKTTDPLAMYLGDICTVSVNIAGIPALSLPCSETADGRPIGMQLLGKAFSEPTLYCAAHAYESACGAYHMERGSL